MPRVKFLKGKQSDFLNRIRVGSNIEWLDIAKACRVQMRTLFDWRRDKYQMGGAALRLLRKKYRLSIPKIEILPENWNLRNAARLGAIRRNELYGNPGTPAGRKKGGTVSALKFRNDPEFAKKVGFKLRKHIIYPQKSSLLAELIGILLGDGSINEHQVRIYNNNKTDRDYAYFIKRIISNLFKIPTTITVRDKNTIIVTASSKNLVDYLVDCGMKKGDKILNGADVPEWILKDKEFSKSCLRGLMDTDGGIYFHNHITKGIIYRHMGLCFTSHSKTLLNSVHKMFLGLNLNCKIAGGRHIFIYDRKEVGKYMQIIGSHNSKHIKRFESYKNSKV